jgi:hypothetical protein
MTLALLHGTFIDEFLIEIVLPLSIIGALYWWSARTERRKRRRKEEVTPDVPDQPPGL